MLAREVLLWEANDEGGCEAFSCALLFLFLERLLLNDVCRESVSTLSENCSDFAEAVGNGIADSEFSTGARSSESKLFEARSPKIERRRPCFGLAVAMPAG